MYGDGRTTTDPQEAGTLAGAVKGDPALLRARATAALDTMKAQAEVDPTHLAAIGYCFGGTVALELARLGADLRGVVSFHGGLETKRPAEPGKVKAKVLALTGADDPYAPPAAVKAFEAEMTHAGVDERVVSYPHAVHGFTNPANAHSTLPGLGYDAAADQASWEEMKGFLARVFAG
jgi:dienelactone hydrolase